MEPITIAAAKKKARLLERLLRNRLPDLSHSEALNVIARLDGARDWNTFIATAATATPAKIDTTPQSDVTGGSLFYQTVLPRMVERTEAHGLNVLNLRHYEITKGALVRAAELYEDLTIVPASATGTAGCWFNGGLEITPRSVAMRRSAVKFELPASASAVALHIAEEVDTGDIVELHVVEPNGREPRVVIVNLQGVLSWWSEYAYEPADDLSKDLIGLESLWNGLERILEPMAAYFRAYERYAGRWHNKVATARFIEELNFIISGKQRYQRADRCFHKAKIGGMTFTAAVGVEGVVLCAGSDWVQIEFANLITVDKEEAESEPGVAPGYAIAKWGDPGQIRIQLKDFGMTELMRLVREFGMDDPREDLNLGSFDGFEQSRAFAGLVAWMKKNPRYGKEVSSRGYLLQLAHQRAVAERKPRARRPASTKSPVAARAASGG